ncbi:MAG: hypothetical protein IME99_08005 [Proteobacteria bacterium]|nr:hypothetical protein [Pseudomonadota bacterium]
MGHRAKTDREQAQNGPGAKGNGDCAPASPFAFNQCTSIIKSTGKKASTLKELRNLVAVVTTESIFHHTYQYFLKGHMLEYTNDFAHWAGANLEESALAEQLANIDPYAFADIEELRGEILRVLDNYLAMCPETRKVFTGDEFYFCETITMVCPVGVEARNMAEFLMALKYIDSGAIYYHFYEARTRLGGNTDDFSKWFEDVHAKGELAERIRSIDPFMHNIEGIRDCLTTLIEDELRREMEVVRI